MPLPDHKTSADYMEGLFHLKLSKKDQMELRSGSSSSTTSSTSNSPSSSPDLRDEDRKGSPGLEIQSSPHQAQLDNNLSPGPVHPETLAKR